MSQPSAIELRGLSEQAAAERLRTEGPNELPAARAKSNLRIASEVLREPMFLLLMATGAVYLLLGDFEEAVALMAGIFVVIGITLYQQRKTERTLQALRDLSSPRALVIRDGQRHRIAGRDVVREDIVMLSEGDRVPADALILSTISLSVDESMLTGESVPVHKDIWDGTSKIGRPGGDHVPAVFSGTIVVQGSAAARVYATGSNTEIGRLGRSLQSIEQQSTNLQRETKAVVRFFAMVSVLFCGVVAIGYGLTTSNWLQGTLAGLALAISMVPEEFPVVLTVFLALGAWRISQQHVLTRRVSAIETLGSATVLCVDKTGTLTMNRMTVVDVQSAADHDRSEILAAAAFASAADPVDPMERALHTASSPKSVSLVREYPLSSGLLAMSRVVEVGDELEYGVFAKGAPEAIGRLCRLSEAQEQHLHDSAREMAARGLRVLGVARGRARKDALPGSQREFRFEFLGLVGLEDPLRPSVRDAIAECHTAGIRVVMITGDFPATAHSIARQIGLNIPGVSMTGSELAAMPDDELRARIRDVNVFARVLPEQKLRLVEALKANGDVVAMTGDGVNDAPALKSANIGIAMGNRGTDVAREAASLVLLNDDFSSIVQAIRLGRRIYDNLTKAMSYIFAIHLPIAGMALLPVIFGLPLILMPLHIVFLELIIDPACSIAFESEPEHPNIMKRRPRDPKARLFDRRMIRFAVAEGLGLLVITAGAFVISLYRGQGEQDARAISYTALILGNLGLIWANRSRTRPLRETLRSRNAPLWAITAGTLLILAAILYVPSIRDLFQFSALHFHDLAALAILFIASITWFEIVKRRASSHAEGVQRN